MARALSLKIQQPVLDPVCIEVTVIVSHQERTLNVVLGARAQYNLPKPWSQ